MPPKQGRAYMHLYPYPGMDEQRVMLHTSIICVSVCSGTRHCEKKNVADDGVMLLKSTTTPGAGLEVPIPVL